MPERGGIGVNARFDEQIRIDQIRGGERIELVATDAERQSVATRLGLEGLDRLDAHVVVDRDGAIFRAAGRVQATLTQRCQATAHGSSAATP